VKKALTVSFVCLVLATIAAAPPSPVDPGGKPYSEKLGETVMVDLVPCPGGEFTNSHGKKVTVKPLYVSKYEVNWDQYDIFCFQMDMSEKDKAAGVDAKNRPSRPYGDQTHGFGHSGYPAIHITRWAGFGFCEWLNKRTEKQEKQTTKEDKPFDEAAQAAEDVCTARFKAAGGGR